MPLAVAKSDNAYPKENVGEFVVAKLDVTTIPPAIRLKREKGKKTFGDYGYVTRKVEDKAVLVDAPLGHSQIAIITGHGSVAWPYEKGHINGEMLKRYLLGLKGCVYYIAGPSRMVAAMTDLLNSSGSMTL